ncbi:MAG: DUF3179 domain-containing protein [Candidatus Marinimicrobia bacterium]|nr:DUF3179 domain-containing protein [Candidatus Neomarinimicrobiota bacterium]
MALIPLGFLWMGCQSTNDDNGPWLIPKGEVFDDGAGTDGIIALDNPSVEPAANITYLKSGKLVIGVKIGDQVRAYPHDILDWHEIVNDDFDSASLAMTYCPLTGSGVAWNRVVEGDTTTFGVTSMLYNSNLMPYDRATRSYWSQMKLLCVHGEHIGTTAETFPVVETTWRTWLKMYPDSEVVTTQTGYNRPYGQYPYLDYRTAEFLIWPISNDDSRLFRKERVAGVIVGERAKVYRFITFVDTVRTINDSFEGVPLIVVGSARDNLVVIFNRILNGNLLIFTPLQGQLPAVMKDDGGTTWDVFGRGLAGPLAGKQLPLPRTFIAYWFAWAAFYPEAEIYSDS